MPDWSPNDLSPTAWYDATIGGSTTAIADCSPNGASALTFGSGTNSPKLVSAVPSMRLSSSINAVLTSTSTSLLDSAAELDIRLAVAMIDWTPSSSRNVYTKGTNTAATAHTQFFVQSTGLLRLGFSNGTTFTTVDSSVATGFADGSLQLIRVTYSDSLNEVKFYTKSTSYSNAATDCSSNTGWTQLGTTRTFASSVRAYSAAISLGGLSSGTTNQDDGSLWRYFQASDTIDGSPLIAWDANLQTQTSYTDGVSGLVWSVQRNTSTVKTVVLSPAANSTRSLVVTGTDDYAQPATAPIPSAAAGASCTLATVFRPFSSQVATNCIWTTRSTATDKGIRLELASSTAVRALVSDGTTTVTTASVPISIGSRNLVGVIVSGSTCRAFVVNSSGVTLGATSTRPANDQTGTILRFANDAALAASADLDAESEMPVATFASALSSADIWRLFEYYDNRIAAATVGGVASVPGPSIPLTLPAVVVSAVSAVYDGATSATADIAAVTVAAAAVVESPALLWSAQVQPATVAAVAAVGAAVVSAPLNIAAGLVAAVAAVPSPAINIDYGPSSLTLVFLDSLVSLALSTVSPALTAVDPLLSLDLISPS